MKQHQQQKMPISNGEAPMTLSFVALLLLLVIDYTGLEQYIPIVDTIHLALLMILFMFLFLLSKNGISEFFSFGQIKFLATYIALTGLAMLHGMIASYAFAIFKIQVVYFLFVYICFYLINSRKRIDQLTSFLVALGAMLVAINFDRFSVDRTGFFLAGAFMQDGNDFAWSLNIIIPFSFYWIMRSSGLVIRSVCIAFFVVLLLGVLGTSSRGAFLTLVAMLLYMSFVTTKKKFSGIFVLFAIFALGLAIAPPNYVERMQNIVNYESDSSSTGRLIAWRAATEMAIDNPVLGVGAGSFNSAYGRNYRREGDPLKWISTHNIYFKILSEYGFFGLAIYLGICFSNLAMNRRTWLAIRDDSESFSIDSRWPRIINMSIIGFMVGGLFLTGVNYFHLFLLTALTMATSKIAVAEGRSMSPIGSK